jgi:PKD repeat protein
MKRVRLFLPFCAGCCWLQLVGGLSHAAHSLSVPPHAAELGSMRIVAAVGQITGEIFAQDTTPPEITCPPNLVLEATSSAGAVATFSATATDAVDGPLAVSFSPSSGSTFALGTTTVTGMVSDAAGNTSTCTFTVTVQEPATLTASFTANPNPAACNQLVSFDAVESKAGPGRTIVSYHWDFGDGSSGTGKTASHTYRALGRYHVRLTVTDDQRPVMTDTATMVIHVDQGNQPPIASLEGSYSANVGEALLLDGSGSTDPDENCGDRITNYRWSINGHLVVDSDEPMRAVRWDLLTDKVPELAFPSDPVAGVPHNIVRLTVTDSLGLSSSSESVLRIFDNHPVACATGAPAPSSGVPVTFNAECSSHGHPERRIVRYEWDFDYDGMNFRPEIVSTEPIVVRAFEPRGTGPIYELTTRLRVVDDNSPARDSFSDFHLVISNTHALTVARLGAGQGIVTSQPIGIDCGAECDIRIEGGTVLTLTAEPGADSVFLGWSGACAGTGKCVITMDAARTVTALFALRPRLQVLGMLPNGSFHLRLENPAESGIRIESSGDLATWAAAGMLAPGEQHFFVPAAARESRRFYRALYLAE